MEIENEILSLLIAQCVLYALLKLIIKWAHKLNSRFYAKHLQITHTPRGAVDNATYANICIYLFACVCGKKVCALICFVAVTNSAHFRRSLPLHFLQRLPLPMPLPLRLLPHNCINYAFIMLGGPLWSCALITNINTHARMRKSREMALPAVVASALALAWTQSRTSRWAH